MYVIDTHFHWWPRSIFEQLCKRKGYPRARVNDLGGYDYMRHETEGEPLAVWADFFDLDAQIAHMNSLGHQVDAVCSIGPLSALFSELPRDEGRETAMAWNEELAGAQAKYPGRLWASAAIPMVDTDTAIEVLENGINGLNLLGASIPSSVGSDTRIDAERLEPFYDRVEELGVPLFLHPTDAVFPDILEGYDGALHRSLGRVVEVSVAASRLILSGIMERHPKLKVVVSHTGGALPYQSGRMDKNGTAAKLPQLPSTYIKRMYTDTVSPHMLGIKFAVEYYGVEHVMYGSDYPCWNPADALKLFNEIGLGPEDQEKIFNANARRILGIGGAAKRGAATQPDAQDAALV
jgi:aminocarboxymuconate-semialdehyde decarboxylase